MDADLSDWIDIVADTSGLHHYKALNHFYFQSCCQRFWFRYVLGIWCSYVEDEIYKRHYM